MDVLSFEPLTPVSFLRRSALVYADRPAVVSEGRTFTYAEHWQRVQRLGGLLRSLGVAPGDRVAVLAPNTHVLLEASTGVAAGGGVLVALNVRLKAREIAAILDHSEAVVFVVDRDLLGVGREAVRLAEGTPRVVVAGVGDDGRDEYEDLLSAAEPSHVRVEDERALLSINYTSGTTGTPKGVMYHHRGAYLQALAMAYHARLDLSSTYLWTLPMFHTNGWCFPWAVTAAGAVHVCLRSVVPDAVWGKLRDESVTHFCAAPTVLTSLAAADAAAPLERRVRAMTGGAPPSPALLRRMHELNVEVLHLYGLTETFGPAVLCDWRPEWDEKSPQERARLLARQGVGNVVAERVRVLDDAGADVPADGETLGQVAVRGNNVMLGYFRDEEATRATAPDGWFRTGDLGVLHPDGYVELRDRLKDIIISGGENISSIEVENVLVQHPSVEEAAVVGVPHEHWGEVPVAFVSARDGAEVDTDELVAFVRDRLAHFKAPKAVVVGALPKTSTGKIQKNVLRETARSSGG